MYEYTSELSKIPHDSQEWGKLLGARDSAEFEFWGWIRGISDELGKDPGDMAALVSGGQGRADFELLWYLHCEAALSSEGPSFSSIPAIRAAVLNYKQIFNQGRFTELLGVAGAAPPLSPQQLAGHAEGNSDSVVELVDDRQQPSPKEQLCDPLSPPMLTRKSPRCWSR